MDNKNLPVIAAADLRATFEGAQENANLRRTVEELRKQIEESHASVEIIHGHMYINGKLV